MVAGEARLRVVETGYQELASSPAHGQERWAGKRPIFDCSGSHLAFQRLSYATMLAWPASLSVASRPSNCRRSSSPPSWRPHGSLVEIDPPATSPCFAGTIRALTLA